MSIKHSAVFIFCAIMIAVVGCTRETTQVSEINQFSLDSMEGIITQSGIEPDKEITSDGKGSLRITASEPSIVKLFEVTDIDIENAKLLYSAKVRTEGVDGQVYLEMWCGFTGTGEFFSRNLESPVTGTTDWSTLETPFFLQKGQNPDYVKLNLVIDGKGIVWIDDIRLMKGPLN